MYIQLLTPLNFLRIRFKGKFVYLCGVPAAVASIASGSYVLWGDEIPLLGDNGLVEALVRLLPILIGFYIAALAAVATMTQENLDQRLKGQDAILERKLDGGVEQVELTRRQFLCFLFGYLAFMSIFLYFAGVAAPLVAHLYAAMPFLDATYPFLALFLYLLLYSNLFTTTLFGLHYLTDRIHRN